MKSKLLLFDLAICSVWMLSLLGGRMSWTHPALLLLALAIVLRFIVSHSLYHREKRSWLPLCLFLALTVLMAYGEIYANASTIVHYAFILTGFKYSRVACRIIEVVLGLWLFVFPLVYFLSLLFRKQLERTSLRWRDLFGGILWHDRLARTCSSIQMVMLTAFLTGLSMDARTCQIMCLTAVPVTYWLLCRYNKVRADRLWVLVISMAVFWYAQLFAGAWRVSMLLVSFGFVVYVGTWLYRNTKNNLLAIVSVLYLSMLLPSFSIGYNQYACLNYARKGFYHLASFPGIFYITDDTREMYGLRDRYGLLIEPEYERIRKSDKDRDYIWRCVYVLQKDGYNRYYDVYNNEFILEPDICPDLQHQIRGIIEDYFAENGSKFQDKGQIAVTELSDRKIIVDVRVTMCGNPFLSYANESFLPDDSICVAHGDFYRNDSVKDAYTHKHLLSHALHVPNDSTAQYRIYVRFATGNVISDSTLIQLAEKVATLKELQQ